LAGFEISVWDGTGFLLLDIQEEIETRFFFLCYTKNIHLVVLKLSPKETDHICDMPSDDQPAVILQYH
jgi:hypothetical protein